MKKLLGIIVLFLFICNPVISAGKYKDIKGFKKHAILSSPRLSNWNKTGIKKIVFTTNPEPRSLKVFS